MANQLPPVPYRSSIADPDRRGLMPNIWADFFKNLVERVGGPTLATSATASGYQRLPSGLMLQWGITSSVASGATQAVTFGKPFSSVCLQVIPGLRNMSGANITETGHFGTGNYTVNGCDIFNRTSAAYVFNWFAVGY